MAFLADHLDDIAYADFVIRQQTEWIGMTVPVGDVHRDRGTEIDKMLIFCISRYVC